MRRHLLTAILLLAAVAPASACLNDATLKGSERQFRSQYQTTLPTSTTTPDTSSFEQRFLMSGIGGAVLIVGAIGLAYRRSSAA